MICACLPPWASIERASCSRAVRMRSKAASSGAPSGRSVRLMRTSSTWTPYWRAILFRELRTLSIIPCRSGDRSEANSIRPSSLRTSEPRIGDPIAREGVHLEAALVGRDHLLALHVDVLNALVDPDDLLDEGNAVGQSGAWRSADGPAWLVAIQDSDRLAETDDDRLLGLRHDREAAEHERKNENADNRGQEWAALNEFDHWARSVDCCFSTWGSG